MRELPDPYSGRSTSDEQRAGHPDLDRRRADVIAALDRLAAGTFARCDVCGVQISDRRLQIAPAADRCLDHLADPGPHGATTTGPRENGAAGDGDPT